MPPWTLGCPRMERVGERDHGGKGLSHASGERLWSLRRRPSLKWIVGGTPASGRVVLPSGSLSPPAFWRRSAYVSGSRTASYTVLTLLTVPTEKFSTRKNGHRPAETMAHQKFKCTQKLHPMYPKIAPYVPKNCTHSGIFGPILHVKSDVENPCAATAGGTADLGRPLGLGWSPFCANRLRRRHRRVRRGRRTPRQ